MRCRQDAGGTNLPVGCGRCEMPARCRRYEEVSSFFVVSQQDRLALAAVEAGVDGNDRKDGIGEVMCGILGRVGNW